jgi:serine-type D-Ala-D-Ala carboxypeptidase/endopeptidase
MLRRAGARDNDISHAPRYGGVMLPRGLLLLAAGAIAFAQSDDEIRRLLSDRIDRNRKASGIVVGVIDPQGARRVIAHGDVKPDSLFEIGSITKVFTALVLTDMVERGEVRLSDPVQKYLPDGVRMPRRGREITLEDLGTHMSGLPRLPTNFAPRNLADPYAGYTAERLYEFLRSYDLTREPGTKWEYSNLGSGLLGHVLSRRAGSDFETMTRLRIFGPLDMMNTWMRLPRHLEERMAVGHSVQLQPVPAWNWDVLAGAGAFWSGADDLLEFVAAALGHKPSGLAPAMSAMLKVRHPVNADMGQAIGWNTLKLPATEIVLKDGGTYGFSSVIAFDPKRRTGLVVLSNAFGGVVDLALTLVERASTRHTGSPAGSPQ